MPQDGQQLQKHPEENRVNENNPPNPRWPAGRWPTEPRKGRRSKGVSGKERKVVAFTENGKLGTGGKWRRKYTMINFLLWEAEGSQRLSLAAGVQARDLSHLDSISEIF